MPDSGRPPNPLDGEPDPAAAATPAQFLDHMKRLRIWAGNPSLNTLNERSGGSLPTSTVSAALNHPHTRLPRLELVLTYVQACGVQDNRVEEWRQSWRRLKKEEMSTKSSEASASKSPRSGPRTRRTKYWVAALAGVIAVIATAVLARGCGRHDPDQGPVERSHSIHVTSKEHAHTPSSAAREGTPSPQQHQAVPLVRGPGPLPNHPATAPTHRTISKDTRMPQITPDGARPPAPSRPPSRQRTITVLAVAAIAAGILGYRIHRSAAAQRLGVSIAWRIIPRAVRDDLAPGTPPREPDDVSR